MKSKLYFESSPWYHTIEKLLRNDLSEVRQISLLVTCTRSNYQNGIITWQQELSSLLGQPTSTDVVQTELATSIISKWQNGTITRLFIDCGQNEASVNFEIVTTEQLIIYKPIASPQAYLTDYEMMNTQVASNNAFQLAEEKC